ncbi:MAG: PAS domain S-box protein [Nitrospinae bacterium]|nr:PAS domain S-box protein [Nitrospinota bacterium]
MKSVKDGDSTKVFSGGDRAGRRIAADVSASARAGGGVAPGGIPGGAIPFTVLTLLLIALVGWYGLSEVKRQMQLNLAGELRTVLNANIMALKLWVETQSAIAETWAQEPIVRENILSLIGRAAQADLSKEELLRSPELKKLRQVLGPVTQRHDYIGFVIFDAAGRQIGALLDTATGPSEIARRSGFVARALKGETVISHPFPGEVALPSPDGTWKMGQPTMFVATPIRRGAGPAPGGDAAMTQSDDQNANPPLPPFDKIPPAPFAKGGVMGRGGFYKGEPSAPAQARAGIVRDEIVAALTFRIRPEKEFARILETSRSGESGETYVFNAEGLLLSDSRFNGQLRKAGLIPDRPDSHAILNLELRDPRRKTVPKSLSAKLPGGKAPLTRMAASAVKGSAGVDVDGYNDYRGVPVVGAWAWLEEGDTLLTRRGRENTGENKTRNVGLAPGVGITTEVDVDEAYAPLIILNRVYLVLCCILGLIAIAAILLQVREQKEERMRLFAENDLRRNKERLKAVISHAMDGIVTIHGDGTIESANPAAERLFGYSSAELIGKNVSLLMPEPYRTEHDGHIEKYLRTGQARVLGLEREVPGLRKNGEVFSLGISVSEMFLGESRMFIGILRDITQRKQDEEKLRQYAAELEKSNEALKDFSFIASHDLQEPLRKIVSFADLLKTNSANLDPNSRNYLNRMQAAAHRMRDLIYDLLQYSRIESQPRTKRSIDLKEIARDVLEDLETAIKQTQGRVETANLPVIEADGTLIRQLFQNLIANGLKFHKAGEPPLVKVQGRAGDGFWEISVQDNGIGFEEKYKDIIFKPFQRLHRRDEFPGAGMGLTICRKIAQEMGWTLAVHSVPSAGSNFTVRIPGNATVGSNRLGPDGEQAASKAI